MQSSGLFVSLRDNFFNLSTTLAVESSSMGTLNEERASQIDYIQKHLENFFSLFHCYLIVRDEDWFSHRLKHRLTQAASVSTASITRHDYVVRENSSPQPRPANGINCFNCFSPFHLLPCSYLFYETAGELSQRVFAWSLQPVKEWSDIEWGKRGRKSEWCKSISAHFA